MATLNLTLPDGRSGTVQVDDSFASLAADKQADTINEISAALAPHPSFSADIQGGLHDLGTAFSQGAKAIGGVLSQNDIPGGDTLNSVGNSIQGITPDEPAGPSAGAQLGTDLKSGNYSQALSDLPHAALRALPSAAPILAAGAIGGPVGAGLMAGAESLGPTAYERAANNGRPEPTTADVVEGLPNVAAQSVLGSVLPGGAAEQLANPVLRAAGRAGIQAAAGGAMDVANQAGATAGTNKGLSIDPYEAAGAGLTQGAIGAGRGATELAKVGIKTGSDNLMARTLTPPANTEDAASVLRVNAAMDAARAQTPSGSGQPLPATVLANTVKVGFQQSLLNTIAALRANQAIDAGDFNFLRSAINNLALRHNNTVTQDTFDRVGGLDLPDDVRAALTNDLRDLNTVSTQSFQNDTTGPFRIAGQTLGQAAGIAGLTAHGGLPGLATGLLGRSIEGRIGGAIGGAADRFLGTNTPPVVLQAINARRLLNAAGIDPVSVTGDGAPATGGITIPAGPPKAGTVPAFIRPRLPVPTTQAAPPFIRPSVPVPASPNPVPGFIRPSAPQAPTPNPSPPFISMRPTPPEPQQAEQTGSNPVQAAQAMTLLRRVQAQAAAKLAADKAAQSQGGPDPVTGLTPDAVPVNVPIKASVPVPSPIVPTGGAQLPPLRVDTPASVRSVMAADDMASGTPQAASLASVGLPAPATAAALQGPSTPSPSPGLQYIVGRRPDLTGDHAIAAAQQAEAVGILPPGGAARLAASSAPIDPALGRQIQRLLPAVAATASAKVNAGHAVEFSEQARVNAREYQANARALASENPDIAGTILAIAQGAKTPEAKQDMAAAYVGAHPEAAGRFPEWLLNHGRRD